MITLRRALEYLYSLLLLALATILSTRSIGIIVTANTSVDPDVSTRDVGVAYLSFFIVALLARLSYGFYKSTYWAYDLAPFCGFLSALFFLVLLIVTLAIDDRSCMVKMQAYIIGIVISISFFIDSVLEGERRNKRSSTRRVLG